ncbi:MAG: CinA family nicotinamide mononucleotide deamidase-related protein [bacterium]|nr:CinA family nicotinamide mononucleotide deamidase-related protein [bacterium]
MLGVIPLRSAACLAVGSELLGQYRLDSNSLRVTEELARFGVRVEEKRVLGDDVDCVADAIRELLEKVDLVVVTGGLGPTADDVTREAVARALGRSIDHSAELESWIRQRYAEYKRPMPDVCLSMALHVDGSRPLPNARGSAPGLLVHVGDKILAVFPGVPREMEAMLESDLVPELEARCGQKHHLERTLLLGGVVESETEARVRKLYDRFGRENVTILASFGLIRLVLNAEGEGESVQRQLDEMEAAFREVLGHDIAGVDATGLEEVVVNALRSRGQTVATAESCTGGLLGAALTEVSGSSEVYFGGVVSYSNNAKESLLAVPHDVLVKHGAVSEEVARAMAFGVRSRFASNWGVGITGIAGPTGGTDDKPVGTVHWAVSGSERTWHGVARFPGNRSVVRQWSVNAALDSLRRRIERGID